MLLTEQFSPQTKLLAVLDVANAFPPEQLPVAKLAGYCFKHEFSEAIVHLLRATVTGAIWSSGGVLEHLLISQADQQVDPMWQALTEAELSAAKLTKSEQQVVALLVRGQNNAQIAAELGLTPQTVCNYNTHIYAKLGVSRTELIARYHPTRKES